MIKEHAKTNKLKLSQERLKEIQSELLLDKTTSFYVFYILAIYYKRNIIIKMDEVYMHFLANECEKDTYLITRNQGKYNIQMQCLKEEDKEALQAFMLNSIAFHTKRKFEEHCKSLMNQ